MPGFNGTGPLGLGPRTGGGRGFCPPGAGTHHPPYGYGVQYGISLRGAGRGGIPWGCGRGRVYGGGRSRWWYGRSRAYWHPGTSPAPFAGQSAEQELEFLKTQASTIEQELAQIRRRIEELEKTGQEFS